MIGTTRNDWTHWADTLGLQEYLLPVVSDTSVPLMPPGPDGKKRTSLTEANRDKVPSRITRSVGEEYVVGVPGWQVHEAKPRDIDRWSGDSRLGICVQARAVRALDIDIKDALQARRVVDFVQEWLTHEGVPLPDVRGRQGVGKCLMPFRVAGGMVKRKWETAHGIIEWLADGQQWLARRDAGAITDYVWSDSDGSPLRNPTTIGTLTLEQFERLWSAVGAAFGVGDEQRDSGSGEMVTRERVALSEVAGDPMVRKLMDKAEVHGVDSVGRVAFRCPFDHASGEYAEGSTVYMPAGTGGRDTGHFKCLHSSCAGRSDLEFETALGFVADEFDVLDVRGADGPLRPVGLTLNTRTGRVEATLNNVATALSHPDWAGVSVGMDTFTHQRMVNWGGGWHRFTDADYTELRLHLYRERGFSEISGLCMKDVVVRTERERSMDSAVEWLGGLAWDGVPRIDRFLLDYMGAADNDYTRAVSAYIWTGMAGRVLDAGCQLDMVPILSGAQGLGKSSLLRVMAGSVEAYLTIDFTKRREADESRAMLGRTVVELEEMKGIDGRSIEDVKAWVTKRREEWIPKYKELGTVFARRFMFFGTTNRERVIPYDVSGYRRWLPVRVTKADVDLAVLTVEQLWAEGAVRFRASGIAWEAAERLCRAGKECEDFVAEGDHRGDNISEWLANQDPFDGGAGRVLKTTAILAGAWGIPLDRQRKADADAVGRKLRDLGYEYVKVRIDGVQTKTWRKP